MVIPRVNNIGAYIGCTNTMQFSSLAWPDCFFPFELGRVFFLDPTQKEKAVWPRDTNSLDKWLSLTWAWPFTTTKPSIL